MRDKGTSPPDLIISAYWWYVAAPSKDRLAISDPVEWDTSGQGVASWWEADQPLGAGPTDNWRTFRGAGAPRLLPSAATGLSPLSASLSFRSSFLIQSHFL